jgi:hypothetical protein
MKNCASSSEEIGHMIEKALEDSNKREEQRKMNTIFYLMRFQEIVRTFEGYGYMVYTMEDINPFYWDRRDFKDIAIKIANTKSVFLMYLSNPLTLEMYSICRSIFDMNIDMDDKPPSLLLGISYYNMHNYGEFNISFIPCINFFEDYVVDEKLKNRRRCEICNLKKKCYRICARCKGKVCIECYNKMNSCTLAPCPYCRYSFNDHVDKELKYII